MATAEDEIVLEVIPDSGQLKKQLQGKWYSQAAYYRIVRASAACSYKINSSRCLLISSYVLLFAVILARCTFFILLLDEHTEMVPTYEGVIVCLDICSSGIWLVYFVATFAKKLRPNYIQHQWGRIGVFILFCLVYYGCVLWSTHKLGSSQWARWNPLLFFLTIAYGFLADKSPNCCLIAAAFILVFAILEGLVRIATCSFFNPFASAVRYFVERRVPALYYDREKHDTHKCTICLRDFKAGERLCGLACHEAHIFHTACIKQWLRNSHVCPCCRTAAG